MAHDVQATTGVFDEELACTGCGAALGRFDSGEIHWPHDEGCGGVDDYECRCFRPSCCSCCSCCSCGSDLGAIDEFFDSLYPLGDKTLCTYCSAPMGKTRNEDGAEPMHLVCQYGAAWCEENGFAIDMVPEALDA